MAKKAKTTSVIKSTTTGTATGSSVGRSVSHGTSESYSTTVSNAARADELSVQLAVAKPAVIDSGVHRVQLAGTTSAVYAVCIVPMGEDIPVLALVYDSEETPRNAQEILGSMFTVGKAVVVPGT